MPISIILLYATFESCKMKLTFKNLQCTQQSMNIITFTVTAFMCFELEVTDRSL